MTSNPRTFSWTIRDISHFAILVCANSTWKTVTRRTLSVVHLSTWLQKCWMEVAIVCNFFAYGGDFSNLWSFRPNYRLVDVGCSFVRDAFWSPTVLRWYRPSSHGGRIVPDVTRTIETPDVMYQKILHNPLVFSDHINPDARSILTGLLQRDPTKRLGVNGAEEIKKHPFFHKHIDFKLLLHKKIQPPFKPKVASAVVSLLNYVLTGWRDWVVG